MNTKVSARKVLNFLDKNKNTAKPSTLDYNNVPNDFYEDVTGFDLNNGLSGETIVETLIAYIEADQTFKATQLADYIIEHGLPFSDRQKIVNYNVIL